MATTSANQKKVPLNRVRNIGIIAHIDAGKTTTSERILFYTGQTYKIGDIDDGGIIVLDAGSGVQSQTETVWRQADKYKVPRIAFVNKMDVLGADFHNTIKEVHEKLGAKTAVMALPVGVENTFRGIVLLLERKAIVWQGDETGAKYVVSDEIPADMKDEVESARAKLVEAIAETDDNLIGDFLDGKEISTPDLKAALRRATCTNAIVPVFPGSS